MIAFTQTISAGGYHSLVLDNQGQVWSFGRNIYGQLGLGDRNQRNSPEVISELPPIKSISAGFHHNLVLDYQGMVWVFGCDKYGQLGLGGVSSLTHPQVISDLPFIQQICTGHYHSLVLDIKQRVWGFGENSYGQLGFANLNPDHPIQLIPQIIPLPPIVYLAAGKNNTFVLDNQGQIWAFGQNSFAQLGLGHRNDVIVPTIISTLPHPHPIQSITSSDNHALFLDTQGQVYRTGDSFGQPMMDNIALAITPTITHLLISDIKAIVAGTACTLVLDNQGQVYSFGRNIGQADYVNLSDPIPYLSRIQQMSIRDNHGLFVDCNGTVYSFGDNRFGQSGLNSEVTQSTVQIIPDCIAALPIQLDVMTVPSTIQTVYSIIQWLFEHKLIVDVRINRYLGGDSLMEFEDHQGRIYLAQVDYNSQTGQISPPQCDPFTQYGLYFLQVMPSNQFLFRDDLSMDPAYRTVEFIYGDQVYVIPIATIFLTQMFLSK